MAGIVEKIRGRSRSRKSLSREGIPGIESNQTTGDMNSTSSGLSSPTQAWHVHKGNRISTDTGAAPPVPVIDDRYKQEASKSQYNNYSLPISTSNTNQNGNTYEGTNMNGRSEQPQRHPQFSDNGDVQNHDSSLQNNVAQNNRNSAASQGSYSLQYPYTVPRRKESLQHNRSAKNSFDQKRAHLRGRSLDLDKPRPQTTGTYKASAPVPAPAPAPAQTQPTNRLPEPKTSPPLGTEIDQALASLSLNRDYQQTAGNAQRGGRLRSKSLEHVRVPTGFNLDRKEKTIVDTHWRPAVTHEDIYPNRTEVVREAISRDIHIHHYYTYIQPIKVVEVLPAKHYRIDERTGLKVEIPAPRGWVMPKHLQPRVEDTSGLAGYTRHYLVNKQYPKGVPEPPPPSDHLNGTANGIRPYQQVRV